MTTFNAQKILDAYADEAGWDDNSKLAVLYEFLSRKLTAHQRAAFHVFVESKAMEEADCPH